MRAAVSARVELFVAHSAREEPWVRREEGIRLKSGSCSCRGSGSRRESAKRVCGPAAAASDVRLLAHLLLVARPPPTAGVEIPDPPPKHRSRSHFDVNPTSLRISGLVRSCATRHVPGRYALRFRTNPISSSRRLCHAHHQAPSTSCQRNAAQPPVLPYLTPFPDPLSREQRCLLFSFAASQPSIQPPLTATACPTSRVTPLLDRIPKQRVQRHARHVSQEGSHQAQAGLSQQPGL
jgi:hypothetical protein